MNPQTSTQTTAEFSGEQTQAPQFNQNNQNSNTIALLEQKIDAIYISVEKTRTYFKWTLYITIALFFLPLVGLVFAIPAFISTLNQVQSLGL